MLKNLTINNIALIDHADIEFKEGLTVLSGETGSGKSIIIDSLSFVLGDRADKTLIKHGADFADVAALFEVDLDCPVVEKLQNYGYGNDTEILVSRKMSAAGKNEIRIQGKTATLSILKDVCSELADIFGQGQHLALLDEANQLAALDSFCDFGATDVALREKSADLSAVNKQLKSFGGSDAERERLADILKYQIDEITNANLDENEENELLQLRKRMMHAEKITSALQQVSHLLGGEAGVTSQLAESCDRLKGIFSLEDQAESLEKRLQSCMLEIADVASTVDSVLSDVDFSESDVDKVEERLEKIKTVKRKYGGSIADALAFLKDAEAKYDELTNSTERIAELNKQKTDLLAEMYILAKAKSEERRKTAKELAAEILKELADLGMNGTVFVVEFNEIPSFDEYCKSASANGFDVVSFLMSANPGEPLKPLSKVISGGEMSRFMLAVKNITATAEKIPTMVFDEIDTGISGVMAQKVAMKLANVSADKANGYQCVVITHLPQIAAMADVNMYIEKTQGTDSTRTDVRELGAGSDKQKEVARLMGSVGEHAQVNAAELIQWCEDYKNQRKKA